MRPSSTVGQYRVYSRHLFRNAPFSKLYLSTVLGGSLALLVLPDAKLDFILTFQLLLQGRQLWRILTSRLFFIDASGLISGCFLIYYMRNVERSMGSRKYADFCIFSVIVAFVIETILLYLVGLSSAADFLFFASGPYSLLSSAFLQFLLDVPYIPYARIYNIPFCSKNLPCLLALQLVFSNRQAKLACLSGVLSGLLYRNLPPLQIVPQGLCEQFDQWLGWLTQLGEARATRVLPMAATIERQRQEIMDEYEQRLIFEQMRNVHRQEQNDPNAQRLHFLSRLFPSQNNRNRAAQQASEDQIQRLIDMGFNREDIVRALESTNNDLNDAAQLLLQR